MRFNKNIGTQEEILMKKAILANESAINDNADATQWLIENAVTRDEDGQIYLGEQWFNKEDFAALYQLIHPEVEG